MTDAAQIARGLSAAQRKALRSMGLLGQIRWGTGHKHKNTTFFKAITFNSLADKGLVWANHEKVYGLLSLGLAVRAELDKTND